ncbi:MAG TPA: hypothetical protein DD979_07290 [Gammaproteobacteria bacterium]|jgi:hypothetical protein|nr:hypothetical protein [Gammaproteobacteria bacterium]
MNKPGLQIRLAFRHSQQLLRRDAVDVCFRAYDLLFACYPELVNALPDNRYDHPDLSALFSRYSWESRAGTRAVTRILDIIQPRSESELMACVALVNQCVLKAIKDVSPEPVNDTLMEMYRWLLDYRTMRAVAAHPYQGRHASASS